MENKGTPRSSKRLNRNVPGVSTLIVQNFKSLARPELYRLEVRPLTLLAGANSSGKSSAVQPLLLLKQTLEATYDPGPLRLHGPHLRFTSTEQILPQMLRRPHKTSGSTELGIGLRLSTGEEAVSYFRAQAGGTGVELVRTRYVEPHSTVELQFAWHSPGSAIEHHNFIKILLNIRNLIHVPGLRGNPERSYQPTAVGPHFPGTFETYVASLIQHWQDKEPSKIEQLSDQLERLGLTWKVEARQLNAAEVELKVGRLPHARQGGAKDLVNIADVGFGVSQVLPVLVALLTAQPGQLVYLEQPEIHLHPRAQIALASILADAANRGVRVIAETHSALLLLAVQTLVAEQELKPETAILHWFQRGDDGITQVTTAELDAQGAYGDWPEDFGSVELGIQDRYLNAVEARLLHTAKAK